MSSSLSHDLGYPFSWSPANELWRKPHNGRTAVQVRLEIAAESSNELYVSDADSEDFNLRCRNVKQLLMESGGSGNEAVGRP